MKKNVHPDYQSSRIVCACGNVVETGSTKKETHVEICAACHPFFTGKSKFLDSAGRIEKFRQRYGKKE